MCVAESTFHFPKSAMTASRTELTSLPLQTVMGQIPQDWLGHLFLMAPAPVELSVMSQCRLKL
jgi:carotenoid cleavage dioxygenase-like enzyme